MTYFWDYEHIPELDAYQGVPRALQEHAYSAWEKDKSKKNMTEAMRTFGKLINSEIGRYKGTLSRPTLQSFAKKYTADAIRSFDPSKGFQLSTHLVNNMQRLHRLNYSQVQGLRSSEELQSKLNDYTRSHAELQDTLGVQPTNKQIAEHMKVSPKFLSKLRGGMKFEQGASDLMNMPLHTEIDPELEIVDLLYHDLPEQQKFILKHKTGYLGAPILQAKEIAEKLGISSVRVTQISEQIAKKIKGLQKHE